MTYQVSPVKFKAMDKINIGFIGAGNMATALIGGLCKSGFPNNQLYVSDPDENKLNTLTTTFRVNTCLSNQVLVDQCQVIVLAVKPQVMPNVVSELQINASDRLFLSIAAGIRTDHLINWFGQDLALVRAMPNTPALVQAGATGLFAKPGVTSAQREIAETIMSAVGVTVWVNQEAQLDAVTALSGSGPAYFFYLMEAMEQAGLELGLDADVAHTLTMQTALGAAKLAQSSTENPQQLRTRVTSPGGTTEAAINHMQSQNGLNIMKEAVLTANRRSEELAAELANKK